MPQTPGTIDAYIAGFPADVQAILQRIRAVIRAEAPDAQETISYAIPAFDLNGRHLIFFAAYKRHVAVYPPPRDDPRLAAELAPYVAGKGTLRFPLNKPIPYELIGRVARARVREALGRG